MLGKDAAFSRGYIKPTAIVLEGRGVLTKVFKHHQHFSLHILVGLILLRLGSICLGLCPLPLGSVSLLILLFKLLDKLDISLRASS